MTYCINQNWWLFQGDYPKSKIEKDLKIFKKDKKINTFYLKKMSY